MSKDSGVERGQVRRSPKKLLVSIACRRSQGRWKASGGECESGVSV